MEMINLLRVLVIIGMISCEDKGGVRLVVRVGEDVVLPCSLGPEVDIEPAVFDWTKDRQEVFLYNSGIYRSESQQFRGRVSHFPDELRKGNASIIIRNIQRPDSGSYSCFFPRLQQQRFNVELLVGVTAMMVMEDGEAILDCSFSANIEKTPFVWKKDVDKGNEKEVFLYSDGKPDPGPEFKGRVSHFPDQLRFGNASIKITKAKPSDSGSYTCFHATVKKEIRSVISLTVDPILKPRPEIEGTSPWPSIELLAQTLTSALLRCIVRGASPKPAVVWTDSDGKILPADEPKVTIGEGNKYDIVLNVTVTKTDHYRCVATQKEISHQVYQTIAVHFCEETKTEKPSIVVPVVVAVLITAVVIGGVLLIVGYVIGRRSKSNPGGSTTDGSKKNGYNSTRRTSVD